MLWLLFRLILKGDKLLLFLSRKWRKVCIPCVVFSANLNFWMQMIWVARRDASNVYQQ